MWACAIHLELRIPDVQSLKAKRAVLRPHIERMRRLASLSVSEVDHHDLWQRAALGVAVVALDSRALESLVEKVRRYVDGQMDIELVELTISYLEDPK
ncbi:MAG: DUF503 domain-containing protein [Acidimicrobiia bacterium]